MTKIQTILSNSGADQCVARNHQLVHILSAPAGFEASAVAMWCRICGAVVVDREYDGRVDPGVYRKMTVPNILRSVVSAVKEESNDKKE